MPQDSWEVIELFSPLRFEEGVLQLLDQRGLPEREEWVECRTPHQVAQAIKEMVVRGAPAIGIAAAFGMALALWETETHSKEEGLKALKASKVPLASSRPTAVNLFWAIERVMRAAEGSEEANLREVVTREAFRIWEEDKEQNLRIGEYGGRLLKPGSRVLTHCNAGALATGGYGTALGVIRWGFANGKVAKVWVDETRPLLQGARLTAWELAKEEIPHTLITDNMAGWLMQRGEVDAVVVGADRITSQGFVANKIGTYPLAVLASHHGIPFYVAAPTSTIDWEMKEGWEIPIEERDSKEVSRCGGSPITTPQTSIYNPAFDVTPPQLITAIVTEKGVVFNPASSGMHQVRGE